MSRQDFRNQQVNLISSSYDPTKQNVKNIQNTQLLTSAGKPLPKLPPPPQAYPKPSYINTQPNTTQSNTTQTNVEKAQTNTTQLSIQEQQSYSHPQYQHKYAIQNQKGNNQSGNNQSGNNQQQIQNQKYNPYSNSMNTSSKNADSQLFKSSQNVSNHPSQSGNPSVLYGIPTHPNHPSQKNIRDDKTSDKISDKTSDKISDKTSDKISDKIYMHFKLKYPATIDASGFSITTINAIVLQAMKKEPLNEKTIGKIIDIIDHKFKMTINSDNRQGVQYDTMTFSMDDKSKISVDKYLENYTNKVAILLDSDKSIEANLPKTMSPASDMSKLEPPEPFSEDFPIRDRAKQTDMMIPEVREYDYYIMINSNDRNIVKSPDPNNFIIEFAPAPSGENTPQKGYIDRTFNNIKSCELLNVVILDTSTTVGSSDYNGLSYPYLLLHFDELQNSYFGSNINLSKSFAVLTNYIKSGNYKYYNLFGDSSENTISKIYNPRINLSKLTTRLLLPDGTPFNFGEDYKNDTSNSCITFGFRIRTIQMNLASQFVNSA
jgi:hypothetical protein